MHRMDSVPGGLTRNFGISDDKVASLKHAVRVCCSKQLLPLPTALCATSARHAAVWPAHNHSTSWPATTELQRVQHVGQATVPACLHDAADSATGLSDTGLPAAFRPSTHCHQGRVAACLVLHAALWLSISSQPGVPPAVQHAACHQHHTQPAASDVATAWTCTHC